jgi:hypothetical protein
MSIGEIVRGSTSVKAQKKGGRADLQSLLLHTKYHPKGRVEIDPMTGLVKNPKNNELYKKRIPVKVESTIIGEKEIAVNGGHARYQDRAWRIALKGPSRYHNMIVMDDYRHTYQGRSDRTAPELTPQEHEEYLFFRSFLKENPTIKVPALRDDGEAHDKVDTKFYAWLEKQDKSKIEIDPISIPLHQHLSASSVETLK